MVNHEEANCIIHYTPTFCLVIFILEFYSIILNNLVNFKLIKCRYTFEIIFDIFKNEYNIMN